MITKYGMTLDEVCDSFRAWLHRQYPDYTLDEHGIYLNARLLYLEDLDYWADMDFWRVHDAAKQLDACGLLEETVKNEI